VATVDGNQGSDGDRGGYSGGGTTGAENTAAGRRTGLGSLLSVDGVDITAPERSTTRTDETPRLRASDAERSAVVEVLQDAMARGLLSHEEGDERMGAAFAARFRDELPALTADLPPAPPVVVTVVRSGWRHLVAVVVAFLGAQWATTIAAGFRSKRFVLTALTVLVLLVAASFVVGLDLFDHGHGHLPGHGGH
jgi:hypothetical protein